MPASVFSGMATAVPSRGLPVLKTSSTRAPMSAAGSSPRLAIEER